MQTPNTLRPEALKLTAQIVRQTRMPFGKAQKQAWATVKLKAEMLQKPVSFFYRKDDGSERFAVGHYPAIDTVTPTDKPGNPLVHRYYDTLVNGWRSFRADRLLID